MIRVKNAMEFMTIYRVQQGAKMAFKEIAKQPGLAAAEEKNLQVSDDHPSWH
jgi:hypothetical protein